MTDIHCHILHGIDDGAADLNTSIEMCKTAVENGIDKIIATPHFLYFSKAEEFFQNRDERINELKEKISELGLNLQIFAGAEIAASDVMLHCEYMTRLTLSGTKYLLLELPFALKNEQKLYEYADYVFDCGLVPIIAHPERYSYAIKDYEMINSLADRGCLFQINIESAMGHFGKKTEMLANAMIKNRLADIMATDSHSAKGRRSPEIKQMLSQLRDTFADDVEYMTTLSPNLLLQNKPLIDRQPQYIKKKLFFL